MTWLGHVVSPCRSQPLQGEQGMMDGSPSWSNSESDELRLLSGPPTTSTMEFQDLSGFKAMLTG